jgi:hypothetical protein
MEHKVTALQPPIREHHVASAVSNTTGRGWILVTVSQSGPNEPMFLFWRKE